MLVNKISTFIIVTLVFVTKLFFVDFCEAGREEGLRLINSRDFRADEGKDISVVVVTHGWLEKGGGDWPEEMAIEIEKKVDPNLWACGYFDWSKGAVTLNPTNAAKYARDVGGEKLAEQILGLGGALNHIHLIGHSSGCWAVSEAAKILAKETKADIHLTFLDAYVPLRWKENLLGDVNVPSGKKFWIDHYYTRDYTLIWTGRDLSKAHNVELTDIDQGLKDHNFPWRWYYATVSGRFPKGYSLNNRKMVKMRGGVEYGFTRSREVSDANGWESSLRLPIGNKAIKLKKKRR